jgi:hypothetical protein
MKGSPVRVRASALPDLQGFLLPTAEARSALRVRIGYVAPRVQRVAHAYLVLGGNALAPGGLVEEVGVTTASSSASGPPVVRSRRRSRLRRGGARRTSGAGRTGAPASKLERLQAGRRSAPTRASPSATRDRWTVAYAHPDGRITVSHLHGHGHATLPVEYVKNHVRLGYAATAHGHQTDTARRGTTHRADRRGREGPPPGGARRERAEDQGPVRPPVPRTAGPNDRARCQDRAAWARTLRTARRSVRRSVDARAARIADSARLLRSRQPTRSRWLLRPERHHGDTPSSILRAW